MRKLGFLIASSVFLFSTFACQISGGHIPPRVLTISQAEAKLFEDAISNPQVNQSSGEVSIRISESQASSYVTFNFTNETTADLVNPQIFFEPGQIQILATYEGDFFQIDGRIVMTAVIESNQPKFTIVSVDFGPFPLPGALTKSLTDQLDKEVAKALARNTTKYQLQAISITSGLLTVTLKNK